MRIAASPLYRLYYWPGLPGRGEFPRLILEEAQVPYVDVGRLPESEGGGAKAIRSFLMEQRQNGSGIYAPPILIAGDLILSQTANICLFLGQTLGLVPPGEAAMYRAHQLQLTLLDMVNEIHNTHHPLGVSLYYQDQRAEAQRAATTFLRDRLPTFLNYLEGILAHHPDGGLLGTFSYVDLTLWQMMRGLDYAFPHAMSALRPQIPLILHWVEQITQRPPIAAYLASDRCLPFNEHGVFRHYPELDP